MGEAELGHGTSVAGRRVVSSLMGWSCCARGQVGLLGRARECGTNGHDTLPSASSGPRKVPFPKSQEDMHAARSRRWRPAARGELRCYRDRRRHLRRDHREPERTTRWARGTQHRLHGRTRSHLGAPRPPRRRSARCCSRHRADSEPSADERRLDLGRAYPIRLLDTDSDELAKLMARAQQVGRRPGAKGTGNQTRRIALTVGVTDVVGDMSQLESSLQHGSTHLEPVLPDDAGSTWIFQSKPEAYDLGCCLGRPRRCLGSSTSTGRRSTLAIASTSGNPGLGICDPRRRSMSSMSPPFGMRPSQNSRSGSRQTSRRVEARVSLRIERTLPRRLFREDLKEEPRGWQIYPS